MSQLILLRLALQNQHFYLRNYLQQHEFKRTLKQCTSLLQRKNRIDDEAGSGLQLRKSESGRTDVSTDVRPLGQKFKENTETASYSAIILVGLGAAAVTFWAICQELFSSSSPNNIYSDALDRVIEDPRVQDLLGAPIKGFGEESRRGRRQRAAHSKFERNGVPHIRMRFYVQGVRNQATVHLETRQPPTGELEYRYLFVKLDNYPHSVIILEDNRALDPVIPSSSPNTSETTIGGLSFASFDGKN